MKSVFCRFFGIVSMISISCFAAFGQATAGTVSVAVTDETGAPIPGATVTLTPKILAAGGSVVGTTDYQGKADFYNVTPGLHVVKAEATHFYTYADDLSVYTNETTQKFITLRVGGGSSYVVVVEDDSKPKPDSIVVTEDDKPLPATTTFRSLLDTSKFVRNEPFAAGISVDGATEPDNTFFVDGQEVTNPRTGILNQNHVLPWNIVQEVGVRSGAETAQYAGSLGGVVNVVTRGGNRDWHGDFGFSFSPKGLNGGQRPFLNRFGSGSGQIEYFQPNKDDSTAFFPYGSVGGPLAKDRLWMFASYSPQIFSNRRTVDYFNSPAPSRTVTQSIEYKQTIRQEFGFIRLDARPAKTLAMSGRYLWSPTIQNGGLPSSTEGLSGNPQTGNGLTGAAFVATRGGRNNSNFVSGDVVWTPNSMFFVGVRTGYGFLNEKLDSYGLRGGTRYLCSSAGSPQNVPGSNCSRGFDTGVNFTNDRDQTERTNLAVDGGISLSNSSVRNHIRAGFQYDRIARKVNRGYVNTGLINLFYAFPISSLIGLPATPGNLGSGYLQRFGVVGDEKGTNQSFYAQDSIRFGGRVSVNAGARFEREDVPSYGETEKADFGWGDKISPRIGISVDPFGNGKTRIYGSYFWNYDRLKLNIFEGLGGNVFFRDYFEILPSRGAAFNSYTFANIIGNDPNPTMVQCPIASPIGYSVCRVDFNLPSNIPTPIFPVVPVVEPDLKPTRQKTWIFGVEQEIGNGFELRARFIRKELENVVEDLGFFNDQGSEYYMISNPGEGLSCAITVQANFPCPRAERKYDALNAGVSKRARSFFFNADYTFSRLTGNYSGLANSDEFGRVAPNGTRAFDTAISGFTADGNEDNGKLATDRPHVLKAFGGYTYSWAGGNHTTSASAFTTVQSGTPMTTYYSLFNQSQSILFGRGDLGRTETFSETDLRVGHSFGIGSDRKYKVEVFSDFLNLFDERNVLSVQNSISSTNFTSATLTAGGCTTCNNQATVYNTVFNGGGIRQFVQNFLNTNTPGSSGIRNDYNLPNRFQAPRSVRFGVNVRF